MKITFFVSGTIRSNFSYRPLALARSLHKLGHDVAIIAPKADKYNDFTPEKIDAIDGVRILQPFQFSTRRLEINLFPYLFGAAKALFSERPDLIYVYKPTPISVVGLLGKLFLKTPIVVDFDDLGSEVMKIEGHPLHQRKLVEWSENASAKYADRIVAASDYLFDHFHNKYPEKPIYLMPNGVDAAWFETPLLPRSDKRIVFMGSLNRRSILEPLFDVLPRILKKVPDVKVLIIGDGKCLSYFKEKCTDLDLNKSVTFTGWLDLPAARSHFHEGDIGYSYMPREKTVKAASNMKISQYMSRGVIPLVSDVNDLSTSPEFERVVYVAKANDLDSLEAVLLRALKDRAWKDKSKEARLFVLKNLNWDTLAVGFSHWITKPLYQTT
jgi:glycosyltransferase involved in cell wall biosynthesis